MDLLAILAGLTANAVEPAEIGQVMPEWELQNWINSKPLKLSDLRGKVVLVRWWTAPGCEYCAHTAPALNEFHREQISHAFAREIAYLGYQW